ncbi:MULTISPECIES: hypothetical protein [Bacillus cereus group]|uniref:Uncharacterized protein n=1 Tax=Bacillus thuringiensis serovar navarrensis TaxID=339658 RepID=A0A243AP11_BACTU|nr:hypothetical protein [Bacillus mycoides]OTY28167.1 hypothetical protein BK732_03405 [Bacillus thuringiensis serovar navarrensis]
MMSFNSVENLFSILLKYPVRIILICIGIGWIFKCIKQGFLFSAALMLTILTLLFIVTYTDILESVLNGIPLAIQYSGVIFWLILSCIMFDYESSRQ